MPFVRLIFMKKKVFGRQFSRDTDERKGLFKSLMNAVVLKERIQTTEEKAKAVKGSLEKLVTKAKKYGDKADHFLMPHLGSDAMKKMITDIAPRFTNRQGGYLRVIKLRNRFGDNAKLAILEWVEKPIVLTPVVPVSKIPKEPKAQPVQLVEAETVNEPDEKKDEKKPVKRAAKKEGKK